MRHLYSLYTSRSGSLPPVSPAAILHDDHILPYLPSMNYLLHVLLACAFETPRGLVPVYCTLPLR